MSDPTIRTGVLLLQLGTPDSTEIDDVRRYLRQFLSDPRVLDLPGPARSLLLNLVILPFRPRRSAEAYQKIWTEEGSPLTVHSESLAAELQLRLGHQYEVAYGMRYQNPSIESAVERLRAGGCDPIVILPLFPQYASASTGSALEEAFRVIGAGWNVPSVRTIEPFYDNPGYLRSAADIARPLLDAYGPDHVLFSYHGLPEKQVKKTDRTGGWCLTQPGCCDHVTEVNAFCYRAQSFATTAGLAAELGLAPGSFSTTFQSRLAGQKWIEPYTDKELPELYRTGVRRLAVLTPSFAADCLETLEEIGIRGRAQWDRLGGDDLLVVPCLNADPGWADAVADLVRKAE